MRGDILKKLTSIDAVLDFAIAGEMNSYELYMKMSCMVESVWMCKTLEALAEEELQHAAKLEAVKAGKIALERDEVGDLGIAEILEDREPYPGMTYRELVVYAIKKENVSHKLYDRLASMFSQPDLKDIFTRLAEEEADHKRRFEIQYEREMF